MGRLTAPQAEDQRQQAQYCEAPDRKQAQYQCACAGRRQLLHGDPPRAQAMIRVRSCDLVRVGECPRVVVGLGFQLGGFTVASGDGVIQFLLGVCEKLIGRSGFGPGTRHSGDAGLRASRGGVVFAARDNQRLVAVGARRIDGLVERDARIAHPLQVARRLHDSGRRNGVACGLLLKLTIDRAGEQCEGAEFADDPAQDQTHGHRHRPASRDPARRPRRDRPGHRTHQQGEHQGERHYGQHRQASRFHDSEARHQPGQHGIEEHNHAGDRICRSLVTFVDFAALSATHPGEPGLDSRAGG